MNSIVPKKDHTKIIQQYLSGIPAQQIGKLYGVSHTPITLILKNNHIKIRKHGFSCDENFFSDLSLKACYWAGFIAADGYVLTDFPRMGIAIHKKDEKHLKKFKKAIKFTGDVKQYISKGFNTLTPYCRIIINSQKVKDDLLKYFNITEKKSLTLKPPKLLSFNRKLAFIAGYIDGDGSIYTQHGKLPTIEILGTYEMLDWINKTLKKYNFNNKISKAKKTSSISRIKFQGTGKIIALCKNIRKLKLPLLERKWSRIDVNLKSKRSRW